MTESTAIFNTIGRLLALLLVVMQSFLVIQGGSLLGFQIAGESQNAHFAQPQHALEAQGANLNSDLCGDTEQECDNCHHCHGSHASLFTVLAETLCPPRQSVLFGVSSLFYSNNQNDIYRPPLV